MSESILVTVGIETKLGAHYSFPDMEHVALKRALPQTGRVPSGQPSFMLINASSSVMSVLFNIVQRITVTSDSGEAETVWEAPGGQPEVHEL